jgi:protein SCO1/2
VIAVRATALRLGSALAVLVLAVSGAAAQSVTGGAQGGAAALDPDRALKKSQAAIGNRVGDYAFRDRQGRQVRLADYRGKPVVVSFVYTGCFSVCPTTTVQVAKAIREARKTLGTGAFRVLTIGFNLPYDSPEAMRDFARRYGVEDPDWEFLSPYEPQLAALVADLGFDYVRTAGGFDHLTQLTILDAEGKVFRQVYGDEFALPLLIDPLQELVTGTPMPLGSLAEILERVRIVCTVYDPKSGRYRFKTSVIGDVVSFVLIGVTIFGFLWHDRRKRRRLERHA